jgi:lincosamide nucleotidyltransferase
VGEALTCLYVGLGRELRGERLTAHRYIQNHAVDRVLELVEDLQPPQSSDRDPFDINRRFEQRCPIFSGRLPAMLQGYSYNQESALAILAFLEENFEINPVMAASIRERALG